MTTTGLNTLRPIHWSLSHDQKRSLRKALLECPCIRDDESRAKIVEILRPSIPIVRSRRQDMDVDNILDACLNYLGGLEQLIGLVRSYDENALQVGQLEDLYGLLRRTHLQPNVIDSDIRKEYFRDLFPSRRRIVEEILNDIERGAAIVNLFGVEAQGKSFLSNRIQKYFIENTRQPIVYIRTSKPNKIKFGEFIQKASISLNYPTYNSKKLVDYQHEISEYLQERHGIIILDGFEMMNNRRIIRWLSALVHNCRYLIVSNRRRGAIFGRETSTHLLSSLTEEDYAKVEDIIPNWVDIPDSERSYILQNRHVRPLQLQLYAARQTDSIEESGEVIISLEASIEKQWQLLERDPRAQEILKIAAFLSRENGLTSVQSETLFRAAGWSPGADQATFTDALDLLLAQNLLKPDENFALKSSENLNKPGIWNDPDRFTSIDAINEVISAQYLGDSEWKNIVKKRLIDWAKDYTVETRYPYIKDPRRLVKLRNELFIIAKIIDWSEDLSHHRDTINIIDGVDRYYYVRGPWEQKLIFDKKRIDAAKSIIDDLRIKQEIQGQIWAEANIEYIRAVSVYIQLMSTGSYKDRGTDIRKLLEDVSVIEGYLPEIRVPETRDALEVRIQLEHARAFFDYYISDEISRARQTMYGCLILCLYHPQRPRRDLIVATYRRLADELLKEEELNTAEEDLNTAEEYYEKAYQLSMEDRVAEIRSVISCTIGRSRIKYKRNDYAQAYQLASEAQVMAEDLSDRRYLAQALYLMGKIQYAQGNPDESKEYLLKGLYICHEYHITGDPRTDIERELVYIEGSRSK